MNFLLESREESEFIPIFPVNENEDNEKDVSYPDHTIILPLRNTVLFPGVVIPITVGREKSILAVNEAYKNDKLIGVVAQKDSAIEEPVASDLETVGTFAKIVKLLKMPDGGTTIVIQGRKRFRIAEITQDTPYFRASVTTLHEAPYPTDENFQAHISSIKDLATQIIQLSPNLPSEASVILQNIENTSFLVNFVCSNLSSDLTEKQRLLEINEIESRVSKLIELLYKELSFAELKNKVTSKARVEIDKQQKEYFLQQQLKSIKEELGGDGNDKEIANLRKKASEKKWSKAAQDLFDAQIEKIERMHPSTPDYSVILNHLDFMLKLPWDEYTCDNYDLGHAEKVLDKEHYGMKKIKERILEYLAVLKLKSDMKSPILCFAGPPGIGKTSLGKSIAQAIGRKYARISLGGLHDESEIRGHRKTYIGAMPGRILQTLKKVNSSNPVIILDEIDKLGNDFRGDPSSAMLEVLDPEQNNSFYDNYLELDYDLSKVLFITTANSLQNIQPALRDRLEIVDLSGYAIEEKIEIAKRYLIPKQKAAHGLTAFKFKFPNKSIEKLIASYTRESGVRELDRQIASIMRNIALRVATNKEIPASISPEFITEIIGKELYTNEIYTNSHMPGVAVGLAWTYVGGDILFIETILTNGKGELRLTGNLGDVMKESASTALSYLKGNAEKLGLQTSDFDQKNIHIHVPEGAVPKDGPSAGITMMTAIASAMMNKPIKSHLAMTGEITLRGQVLPVGGIKEKILAARRAGIKEVILCYLNEKDVNEIEPQFIKGLKFHYVKTMKEVLDIVFEK